MRWTAVACSLKPKNTHALRNLYLSCSTKRDRPPGDLFLFSNERENSTRRAHRISRGISVDISLWSANMLCFECAPVAQRIEHLPCWSLNGECGRGTHWVDDPVCGDALRASGTMDLSGPGKKPRGLGNPQETVSGLCRRDPQRLYGSGLRCPRYSPASNPSFDGRSGKPDAGS